MQPADGAIEPDVLAEVAAAGSADSGGVPVELLEDFLTVLAAAVSAGRPITRAELRTYRGAGQRAVAHGVALRALLDLYLSSARRLWRHLPAVINAATDPDGVVEAGEVMLRAIDDVAAELAEGFGRARRALVRAQVSGRREFVDDLLSGAVDVAGVLRRAAGFGLDLAGPHTVAVVGAERPLPDSSPLVAEIERAVQPVEVDAQTLVARKEGRLVVVFPAADRDAAAPVVARLTAALGPRPGEAHESAPVRLRRPAGVGAWQVAVGRPGLGVEGVLASYREAVDALGLATRIGLTAAVLDARDLVVYQVLLRDRPALDDLIATALTPLRAAKGGARPLVDTLITYFGTGANNTLTARLLHLSVRAVTYRLERVRELTGYDPDDATDRFTLHVAALGARLTDWPDA